MEREVIHLSFGPKANALNTDFFNTQSSYFVYKESDLATSYINAKTRFSITSQAVARAAFWDFRNALGHRFGTSQFENVDNMNNVQILDSAAPNTQSWTNQLQVKLDPRNIHRIPNWEVDDLHPNGRLRGEGNYNETQNNEIVESGSQKKREFVFSSDGKEALISAAEENNESKDDYVESTVRPLIEKCDSPDGFNIVTDLDAWGGFSADLSTQLVDEYSKLCLYTWAIASDFTKSNVSSKTMAVRESRLENILAFCENSTLVFPVENCSLSTHMESFETVSLLSSLRSQFNPVHMLDFSLSLTRESGGNIVDVGHPIDYLKKTADTQILSEVYINRTKEKTTQETNEKTFWLPQLMKNRELKLNLQVNTNPLNLRKYVPLQNHELKEQIYELTDVYNVGFNSDSEYE